MEKVMKAVLVRDGVVLGEMIVSRDVELIEYNREQYSLRCVENSERTKISFAIFSMVTCIQYASKLEKEYQ